MLASLLPGVREIRTPLVVGYAWLVVLWLAVGYRLPTPDQARGVLADIYRIADDAGRLATGSGISVGAYRGGVVAGSLTSSTTDLVGEAFRRTPLARITPERRRRDSVRAWLEQAVVERLSARFLADQTFRTNVLDRARSAHARPKQSAVWRGQAVRDMLKLIGVRTRLETEAQSDAGVRRELLRMVVNVDRLVDDIESELDRIVFRLRVLNDAMYDEYDRLLSESEFRLAMSTPVLALFSVMATRWHPWWSAGVVVAVMLLYVGAGARTKAGRLLAGALAAASVDDQALTRLDTAPVRFFDDDGTESETAGADAPGTDATRA